MLNELPQTLNNVAGDSVRLQAVLIRLQILAFVCLRDDEFRHRLVVDAQELLQLCKQEGQLFKRTPGQAMSYIRKE